MKVKRDNTEESRAYWKFIDDNSEYIKNWPEWKKGSNNTEKGITMTEEQKNIIKEDRRIQRNKLNAYRRDLETAIQDKCVAFGGHEFWDWYYNPQYNIGGNVMYTHIRSCYACGKREYKTEEK